MFDRESSLGDGSAITEKLIRAIEQDSNISSTNLLCFDAIRDNLPAICHTVVETIAKRNPDLLAIANLERGKEHGKTRSAQDFTPEEVAREFYLLKQVIVEQLKPQLLNSSPTEIIELMSSLDLIINKVTGNCFETYAASRQEQVENLRQQIFFTHQEIKRLVADHQDSLDYLAHEIKNPLTSIIGYSDLYLRQQQYDSPTDDLRHIKQVLQQGRNALRIVNDMVELADYQQGNFKLKMKRIRICTLLEDIFQGLGSEIEAKNISLVTSCSPQNLIVRSDYLRLQQIVTNLLTNAIRYTTAGTIEISCYLITEKIMEIKVTDTGVGIPLQHCERVFEPYFRGDLAKIDAPEGVGLGLAVVSQLVDILEGKIELDSQVDLGSTFIVQIPIAIEH